MPEGSGVGLFGSGLTLDDLSEEFWHWPVREGAGATTVLGHSCRPVDFHRPGATRHGPAIVRAWIAPDILLPLQIETFTDAGALLRRIVARKIVRLDQGRWATSALQIQAPGTAEPTTLAFQPASRWDVEVPAAEFTLAGLRESLERLSNYEGDAAAESTAPWERPP